MGGDPPASAACCFALQNPPQMADLAQLLRAKGTQHGAAIGLQFDDADSSQFDEGLTNGRYAHAQPLGQVLDA